MRVVVIGSDGIARELLRRLGESWDVTVVDSSRERLDRVASLRDIRTVEGDGSSRVVLNRAGIVEADAVIAGTRDDDRNLEICRLASDAGISRIVAVAADPERATEYHELGISVVVPDGMAARRVELHLEPRRILSTAFADGRAEAIEFRVAADSPVRGKALKTLHAESWVIGAVLRDGNLIIPHGDTVLQTDDLVMVVGDSAHFSQIVRMFTAGEGRFPLDYGKRVAVALTHERDLNGAFAEAVHLVRNSRAFSLVVVHRDPDGIRDDVRAAQVRDLLAGARERAEGIELRMRPVRGNPATALWETPDSASIGVIVLPAPPPGMRSWRTVQAAAARGRRAGVPVLLSRGAQPWKRIVTPARQTPSGQAAARAAIDLSRLSTADLHSLAVVDPVFLAGPAAPDEARQAVAWIEDDAAMQGIAVRSEIRRGNPVRTFEDFGAAHDLLVVAAARVAWNPSPKGGIATALARRASGSVLMVPVRPAHRDDG